MIITLHQLLTNPVSSGSGDTNARYRIIADLKKRYQALRNKHEFRISVYEKVGITLFYIQVPSETLIKKFYFDVLIQVNRLSKETKKAMLASEVKIFSNNMSFTYTYAYVANKENLIIPFLKSKIEKKALTKKPVIRNPPERLGFEKSIFYASQFILENRFFEREIIRPIELKEKEIFNMVRDTETIYQQ